MIAERRFVRDFDTEISPISAAEPDAVFGIRESAFRSIFVEIGPWIQPVWHAQFNAPVPLHNTLSGTYGMAERTQLCVVCHGTAFIGDVRSRQFTEISLAESITEAVEVAEEGLLILASRWTVTALDGAGVAWTSERLSIESLRLDEISSGYLLGVADPEDDERRDFRISLHTGLARL